MKKTLLVAGLMLAAVGASAQTEMYSGLAGRLTDAANNGARIVGYQSTESGSAARTVQQKLDDAASALDFPGCDKTGAADSTACLQAAITANYGKTLYVPGGTYRYTSLTVSSPITIIGDGEDSTIFKTSAATGDGFMVTSNSVVIGRVGFDASVTRTAGAFVHFTSASSAVTLRDFYMANPYIGVQTECAAECRVLNGRMFGGAVTAGSAGALVDGGNDTYFDQITMDAPAGSQPAAGIQVTQTGALNITDSDIIHHTADLLINPGTGQSVASLYAENTYFDTAVRGVSIVPTGNGVVIRLHFIGCWTSSHTDSGFFTQSSSTGAFSGIELIGHHAILNAGSGALFNSGTTNPDTVKVLGGEFAGNGQNGIAFGAGVSNFSVIGAHSGAYAGQAGNGQWGILVSAGASNNYLINANQTAGNTGGTISDGGTGTSKWITGNLPYTAPAQTAPTVGASPWTYTNTSAKYQTAYINGGTVSVVAVGGSNVFTQTNCTVRIAPGQSMTVTYSVAPGVGVTTD